MAALVLPANYPLVGVGLSGLMVLNAFQSMKVMGARKMHGVNYPTLYASAEEIKADPKKETFNCVQRAHQNTLENVTFVIAFTLYFGLFHPKVATAFSLIWAFGRLGYTQGYASGNPANRLNFLSKTQYIGLFGLFLGSVYYGAQSVLSLVR